MAAVGETGASQGDATQALWSQYHASIYRYALSQLRSPQDAEDATQNTFLRAFNALQRGVVPQNEAAWLFKIAHNTCTSSKLAWLRRRRVETPHDIDLLDAPAAEHRHDELAGLGDALARMPVRPREAFLLREWQGLSYAEIAAQMNTSQSAVETLIFRARRTLAEQLGPPVKRARQALGLGPLIGILRGRLGGSSLAVKAAGAAAVVVTATVAATQTIDAARTPQHPRAPAAHSVPASVPAPAHAQPSAHARRTPPAAATPAAAATPKQLAAPPVTSSVTPPPATPVAVTAAVTPPALPSLPTVPPAPAAPALPTVPALPAPQLPPAPQLQIAAQLPAVPLQIAPAVPELPQLP
jgi:RNA polymerase sigma-70 factor (ECF subfamily)